MSASEDTGKKRPAKIKREDLQLPVRKIPAASIKFLLPRADKSATPHFFTERHLRFLEAYAETLDMKTALDKSGMTRNQVTKSPYLTREVLMINQAAGMRHRNKISLGRHERLMEKFEGEFDGTYDKDYKKSMASTLARMSEASLKAAGEFTERQENTGITGVQVVINIGDGGQEVKSVEGTVIDIPAKEVTCDD